MSKKIRIKDIAELAGVSAGTVDRVLHNRGNVSNSSKDAIESALEKMKYKPNIHVSALTLKKRYNFVITIPQYSKGQYWESFVKGVQKALDKYEGLEVSIRYCFYNQFDLFSCRKAFEEVINCKADAVIIGPTFRDETIYLANQLSDMNIPYIYVDSMIEGTSPLAFFIADPHICGYLMCKLVTHITPKDSGIALFQAMRVGDESANTTILRKAGFMSYYNEYELSNKLHKVPYSAVNTEQNDELIGDFFQKNPDVKGAVVLNSRGNIIADYFRKENIKGVKFICIDLTETNIKALKDNYIHFIMGQRPDQQGYMALEAFFQYLIYGKKVKFDNYMPIDIITKENVDLFINFNPD
ncbi:MAG: LacI family DNA-binding transcriptional regulator [Candidatus Azobacteroides sp.]|nr:LacI family DNA-binding transcriptional regulator [Candidatus Azobacteroides sp.]